jgi:FKBP-type peptidyl-prolyl cis-trans isomerase
MTEGSNIAAVVRVCDASAHNTAVNPYGKPALLRVISRELYIVIQKKRKKKKRKEKKRKEKKRKEKKRKEMKRKEKKRKEKKRKEKKRKEKKRKEKKKSNGIPFTRANSCSIHLAGRPKRAVSLHLKSLSHSIWNPM